MHAPAPLAGSPLAPSPIRARVYLTVTCLLLLVGVAAGMEVRGRGSRRSLPRAAGASAGAWVAVSDAAEAFRLWEQAGVHGRRLVVLTGRWSRPRSIEERPGEKPRVPFAGERADRDTAIYLAAHVGIARRLDVVMPPAAYAQRRQRGAHRKEFAEEDGAFSQHYEGLERRFSTPRAFRAPPEPAIVLVEPSFFGTGAPSDPAGWLASRGVDLDLAVVALDDPAADDGQRAAAAALVERLAMARVEVAP